MRGSVAFLVLLSFACSSSATSQDSASAFGASTPDSNLYLGADLREYTVVESVDAGVCGEIFQTGVPVNLGVDAGSCEARPTLYCDFAYMTVKDLADGCGGLPLETWFIVSFVGGCADHLYPSPGLSDHPIVTCLVRALEASRFTCGEQATCAGWGNSVL